MNMYIYVRIYARKNELYSKYKSKIYGITFFHDLYIIFFFEKNLQD